MTDPLVLSDFDGTAGPLAMVEMPAPKGSRRR